MKKNIWLRVLLSVMLLALLATVFVACKNDPTDPIVTPGLKPDYPAPPVEEGSEDIGGEEEDKLESPQGGGAVGLVYSDKVTVDLSDKKASFRFDNPTRSTNNMSIQLMIQDIVVMESGTLKPGKRITSLDITDEVAALLTPGVYATNAKFVVYFYDPVTNERAIVNSEIAVTVTVQE